MKLTQEQQRSLKRAVGRRRVSYLTKDLGNGGNGSCYGDIVEALHNKYRKTNIRHFNRDSVFLLGNEVNVDVIFDDKGEEEAVRFYCVLSTENFLLNAPRQQATGQQMVLAVGASYQYVIERDHGLFVVKCINHCQSAKTIAYAIYNQEDKQSLIWIFNAIKDEIEATVNGLIQNHITYM